MSEFCKSARQDTLFSAPNLNHMMMDSLSSLTGYGGHRLICETNQIGFGEIFEKKRRFWRV
ncbi:hypothetical protein DERF_014295 [Dermatophagoides farinae]|uniref:Uncharacterized protein n=1 Tax=Dermatophagoides farinae TaxID=6954 RepID=A0A922HHT7_DERFA|nr:hypothetical protein DERF_014295 [Dermatophagoides farinae]